MAGVLIDVQARYAQAVDALERVTRSVDSLDRATAAVGSTFKNFLAGFAGAFTVDALARGFFGVVDSVDALNDASDKTGASVEELSSLLNTLKPYGGSLESITTATGQLAKAMDAARDSGSKQAEAFKALGISTKDARGNLRGTTDVLGDIARAFDGYADGTNKTVLAQVLLGKSGAELLPMLKDLAGAEKQAASVTTEQAQQAERLNKALGALKVQAEAAAVALTSKLVIALGDLAEKFAYARSKGLGFWDSLGTLPGPNATTEDQIKGTVAQIDELTKARDKLAESQRKQSARGNQNVFAEQELRDLQGKIDQAQSRLQFLQQRQAREQGDPNLFGPQPPKKAAPDIGDGKGDKVSDGEKLIQQLKEQILGTAELTEAQKLEAEVALKKYKELTPAQLRQARALAEELTALKQGNEDRKEAQKLVAELAAATERAEEAEQKEIDRKSELANSYRDLIDPMRDYQRKIDEIRELVNEGLLEPEEANKMTSKMLANYSSSLGDVKAELQDTVDLSRDFGLVMKSSFEEAIFSGKSFGEVLKGLISDLAKIVLRKTLLEPMVNSLLGIVTGSSTSAASAVAAGTSDLSIGSAIGKSGPASATIVQYNTFTGGASPAEMTMWADRTKNATLQAVAERERR